MSDSRSAPDWVCVNECADWPARDSQGEFVYGGHLWILGGWFTPQTPNPRDVWKSPDGRRWTCVAREAPWEHSDLSAAMVFRGRMWFMGGRKLPGAENSNKVWSSTDGADWTLETRSAGWCPRVAPSFAVFRDRMWILGGTESFYDHSDAMVKNDVWSSADGGEWRLETAHAGWSKRAHAQAVVFNNKLWILGGGLWSPQHVAANDVWCSEDGVSWTQVTASAPWQPRLWFSVVVYRGRMWVLGGWSREHGNFGDVWYSSDGRSWTELRSPVIWKNRHEHSAFVFQDRIWVAGGYADALNSEVWSLTIPEGWFGEQ
ncbi:MAG: galactose oxidase [Armatimonadetes bacterium]|nr:galactose oxidase [Armatimonadota bacterium]